MIKLISIVLYISSLTSNTNGEITSLSGLNNCALYCNNFVEATSEINLLGEYKGKYQQKSIRLFFYEHKSNLISKNIEHFSGSIDYAGKKYELECFNTEERGKFEVRLKRPSNPALLGEFLAWKAHLKVNASGNIELTVISGLSLVEKVKYSLPNQGAKIVLNHISDNRKMLFEETTTFCGEDLDADAWYTVTYFPNGTCTFDGGIQSDEEIEGEYTRFHSDGRYYILNMVIHVVWEDDNQEAIYKLISNGNQYRDGQWILKKQK